MLSSVQNDPLIRSPLLNQPIPPIQTLMLNQIEGYDPVKEFTDSANVKWSLAKAASDSTRDVPDPKSVQITSCWCHEFPKKLSPKIYVYAVEAIRPPRVATEQPSMLLYTWFSTVQIDFNPSMITDREWLKANVYAAPLQDTRMSKLLAICGMQAPAQAEAQQIPVEEDKLLQVEGIANVGAGTVQADKKTGGRGRQAVQGNLC